MLFGMWVDQDLSMGSKFAKCKSPVFVRKIFHSWELSYSEFLFHRMCSSRKIYVYLSHERVFSLAPTPLEIPIKPNKA